MNSHQRRDAKAARRRKRIANGSRKNRPATGAPRASAALPLEGFFDAIFRRGRL